MVNLPADLSSNISVISDSEETLIVAPLTSVILVVPPELIESKESILEANVLASIVVSLIAIEVMPVTLLKPEILEAKVPRSARLLDDKVSTFEMFTTTVVNAFKELRSDTDAVESPDAIAIV